MYILEENQKKINEILQYTKKVVWSETRMTGKRKWNLIHWTGIKTENMFVTCRQFNTNKNLSENLRFNVPIWAGITK